MIGQCVDRAHELGERQMHVLAALGTVCGMDGHDFVALGVEVH